MGFSQSVFHINRTVKRSGNFILKPNRHRDAKGCNPKKIGKFFSKPNPDRD